MLPQRFVNSLILHILNIILAMSKLISACLPCILAANVSLLADVAINLVANPCPSANAFLASATGKALLLMYCTVLYFTGLDWTGLDWTGLDWTGPDWTGLDWTGLDWTGLAPW